MPAALACFLGYLAARGFGAMAPLTEQTGAQHQHKLTGPIETVLAAVRAAASGLRSLHAGSIYRPTLGGPFSAGTESIVLLAVLVIAVLALVAAFRRLPLAYAAYAGAALLVCTWSPVAGQPLKSLDRYTLTIFPLWMAAGAWISERRTVRVTLLVERRRCWRSGHSSSRPGRGWHESWRLRVPEMPGRPGRNDETVQPGVDGLNSAGVAADHLA